MNDKTARHPDPGIDAIEAGPGRASTGQHPVRIRLVAAPQCDIGLLPVAIASGLLCPAAFGAPGDLDPAFANIGRAHPLPELAGSAWALEALEEDGLLAAGGDYYCSYYYSECDISSFAQVLSGTGARDPAFAAAQLEDTDVFDVALQADGKAVGVGFTREADRARLTVFRLQPDGSLDVNFGTGGVVYLDDPGGSSQVGRSLVIEPDGRITVAGTRGDRLIVVRLLESGGLDPAFGVAGVYEGTGPASGPRLVRTPAGGYRVTFHPAGCRVLGLDANGVPDNAFGTSGIATAHSEASADTFCTGMALQDDGALVLVGNDDGQGFAARLLANGAQDPGFNGAAVADVMHDATALALGQSGSIMVAGHDKTGMSGTLVVRLQSDGQLDALFGSGGSSLLELESDYGSYTTVHDMQVLADGRVVMAGGARANFRDSPFVARLLGEGPGGGPGVLSVRKSPGATVEQDGQATLVVRRTGGSSGAVSVAFQTEQRAGAEATEGEDYTRTVGRLEWPDGDTGERLIGVPIAANSSVQEGVERFDVVLSDPQGGAGLGTRRSAVAIEGDGYPAGVLSAEPIVSSLLEADVAASFRVIRSLYSTGTVSVTVTPVGITATANEDFTATPVTVTWADGDFASKVVSFTIRADKRHEDDETFTVALSSATGGAVVSSQAPAAVTIMDNDRSNGGGRFGMLGALLLGCAGVWRAVRRTV